MFLTRTLLSKMAPFPIALCGKNPNLATSFVQMMNEGSEFEGGQIHIHDRMGSVPG